MGLSKNTPKLIHSSDRVIHSSDQVIHWLIHRVLTVIHRVLTVIPTPTYTLYTRTYTAHYAIACAAGPIRFCLELPVFSYGISLLLDYLRTYTLLV
jgi:hypothetical protein